MTDLPRGRALGSATSLNPDAGGHVVTADPRELAACERAGDHTWSTWSYYARRYGERGRQFTRSDSAWLVALASHPAPVVERQIDWLATVLAARGMPRLLLEQHLRILHAELETAIPERASEYAVLLEAADRLDADIEARMPERARAGLESSFRDRLDTAQDDDMRTGALIGAAVADEEAAVPGAVESLLEWLADPTRFSADWLAAVEQTLAEARRIAAQRLQA